MMKTNLRGVIALAWAPIALVATLVLVGLFAVAGIPVWLGLLVGPLLGIGVIWWALRGSVARLLAAIGAESMADDRYPQFDNIVEGLALSAGLAEPELYIINDAALNAASLDWDGDRAIAVTTGLLEACGRIELEGVIAGLLVRLKQGDAERATVGAVLFGRPIIDSSIGSVASPIARIAFGRLFESDREIAGDQGAVSVTRYPPGLSAALTRIEIGPYEPKQTSAGLQHLWFVPPHPDAAVPHTPINWRLDVLSEI